MPWRRTLPLAQGVEPLPLADLQSHEQIGGCSGAEECKARRRQSRRTRVDEEDEEDADREQTAQRPVGKSGYHSRVIRSAQGCPCKSGSRRIMKLRSDLVDTNDPLCRQTSVAYNE
jgi:hypothetical protein